jgi:hypothetical protein
VTAVTLLYLDLNYWINLAKARLGRPKVPDGYRHAYALLRYLTQAGALVVPLSEVHYSEMRDRIRSDVQRNELALTMAELSDYAAMPPRETVLAGQLNAAVARELATPDRTGPDRPLLGYGVGYAQRGRPLNGRLVGQATAIADPDAMLRQALEATETAIGGGWRYSRRDQLSGQNWRQCLTGLFNEAAEFMILRGPTPAEDPDLRTLGYDPAALQQIMIDLADREKRMKTALMSKAVKDRRPDDVSTAAALALDPSPRLMAGAMAAIGRGPQAAGGLAKEQLARIVEDTPILDVERALRLGRLKNRDYSVEINDLYDMAALGVAVSCCDVVATDRSASARAMLLGAGIQERYGCSIVAGPAEFLQAIRGLQ